MLRHVRGMLRPGGRAYVSTPNVLTLAPEGAERSDNPWHVTRVPSGRVQSPVRGDLRPRGDARPVPRPQAARARAGAARPAGTPCTQRLGITKRVLRPLHAGDRRVGLRAARTDRSTARSTSSRCSGDPCRPRAAPGMSRDRGALALVLHSHMPYVEGFGTWPFGEEWLWEAVATVYLPLIELLEELEAPADAGPDPGPVRPARDAAGPGGRPARRLPGRARAGRCTTRTRPGLERDAASPSWRQRSGARAGDYERRRAAAASGRPRAGAGARAARRPGGRWSCGPPRPPTPCSRCWPATPACASSWPPASRRTSAASAASAAACGCRSAPTRRGWSATWQSTGCGRSAWTPQSAHGSGAPEQLEPVLTAAGVVAVPIDWQTVELVWHDRSGYPVHAAYRDYHRRTVHDLRPWSMAGGPYDPDAAAAQAAEHARDFVGRCIERLDAYAGARGRPGLLCCALDTELLGHWWYEGQAWLRARGRAGTRAGAGAGHGERGRRAGRAGASGPCARPPGARART